MGDTLFSTAESIQSSNQYPTSLALTRDTLLEEIATTIPLLCLGLLGFAVATCLFVTQCLTLPASSVIAAIVFAFIAALLDFSQALLHSNGGATSGTLDGFFITQEVFLVIASVFTYFFYLTYLGRPPYGELDNVPQERRREARNNSPVAWGASGFLGSFAYVVLAGAIFAVAILQVMWRLFFVNPANGLYRADGIVQIVLSLAFFVKLWLNVWLSPLTPRWKTFRNYAPVTVSISISLTIAILNVTMCKFSESSLGRFLQAIQLYILATFMLITPFYGLKRSDESPDTSLERSSFQGLNTRNTLSTSFRVSPRKAPSVLPTTAAPSTRPATQRRSTPERIATWLQRSLQVPNRRDPLQTRLWNANGSEKDVETASPSPNVVPTTDDSPLDAKFPGEPLTVKWLDPPHNTPRGGRNLTMTPEVNPRLSQEITLPTKTRAGSLLLSGRKSRLPPSPTGPPPSQLPAIPTASPAATRIMDSFGPYKLETSNASARSSRTPMPYYPPPRRPVSDGYPLSLTGVNRNAAVPRRALPLPPPSRPNAEGDAPARPATWTTQDASDAFAQIDALLRDGLQTPLVVERRSSTDSSKRNSYDSGMERLRKEQEELDRSIAELNMFSSSQNASYFPPQQSGGRPTITLKVPPGGRESASGDGDQGFGNEPISSSGVSSSGAFMPKSGSYRSEFSLSNFPSPPHITFRMSSYYPDLTARNSINTAIANAAASLGSPSSGSQDTVARAPFVRNKRPMTVSISNTIVPEVGKDKEEEKVTLQAPAGEETEFWDPRLLRYAPEERMEGRLASVPSTLRDSAVNSISDGQQVAQIVSAYSGRDSDGSTVVGQGALKAGKGLDVTSFIGDLMPLEDDVAPPRRPWLVKPGDRLSTDSQELSAAEILKARSTTIAPAVKISTSQAIGFTPSASATNQPSIHPLTPRSRAPHQSSMKKISTGLPSNVARARSRRMKPLPLGKPSTSTSAGALPNATRVPQSLPRRGAVGMSQPVQPLARQASNPSTGGTSATLRGQQSTPATATAFATATATATTASTAPGMPATARSASRDKDVDAPDSRLDPAPAPAPAPALPAPVGIARILAEMADDVENGNDDRVREKKGDIRRLRTPPFPSRKSNPATRPQRF